MARITLDDIQDAENELATIRDRYLRQQGWDYTCKNPGALWLYAKVIEGKPYTVEQGTALWIESHLDELAAESMATPSEST